MTPPPVVRPLHRLALAILATALAVAESPAMAQAPAPPVPPSPASATPPGDPYSYPFPALVVITETGAAARYMHRPGSGRPDNQAVTVELGEQAAIAHAFAAAHLFQPSSSGAVVLRLQVSVGPASLTRLSGAWVVSVAHQVVAVDADGVEVGRWALVGQGEFKGLEQRAIPDAFARAARQAAEGLGPRFDASPEVGRWLAARGYRRRIARPPEVAKPVPPRPAWSFYLDGGFGQPGDWDVGVRAGLGGRWLYAQLSADRWTKAISGTPYPGGADLVVWMVGAEAGPVWRLSERLELRGGAGLHALHGVATANDDRSGGSGATMRIPKTSLVPSLGGAFAYLTGPQGRWLGRGRVAVEARWLWGTSLHFDALGATANAPWSLLFLLGAELPAGF